MRVLLDASNLAATGPEVLIRNLVPCMGMQAADDEFILLLPSLMLGSKWELPDNIQIEYVQRSKMREIGRMWDINYGLARLCHKLKVDIYFTLGDVGPVTLSVPHLIYLHQPYLVYTEAELLAALPLFERIKLRYQRWHFSRSAAKASGIIVQTPVMKKRLIDCYSGLDDKVTVVPPSLPAHVESLRARERESNASIQLSENTLNLLFLATYYAHKNHAILPALLKELCDRNLREKVHFYLTLDGDRRREETELLQTLASDYHDMVTNLGRLTPDDAGSALIASDALFMPTLVETFGLIYLEALAVHKPIITSDRDFARYICGNLALYSDPHDPVAIADAIQQLFLEQEGIDKMVQDNADEQIEVVSGSTEENAESILRLLRKVQDHG